MPQCQVLRRDLTASQPSMVGPGSCEYSNSPPPQAFRGTDLACVLGAREWGGGDLCVEDKFRVSDKTRVHTSGDCTTVGTPADSPRPIALLGSLLGACIL